MLNPRNPFPAGVRGSGQLQGSVPGGGWVLNHGVSPGGARWGQLPTTGSVLGGAERGSWAWSGGGGVAWGWARSIWRCGAIPTLSNNMLHCSAKGESPLGGDSGVHPWIHSRQHREIFLLGSCWTEPPSLSCGKTEPWFTSRVSTAPCTQP